MSGDRTDKLDKIINAYADGALRPDQLRELKLAAAKNARLRAALKKHAEIDASLKRSFEPPPVETVLNRALGQSTPGEEGPSESRKRGRRWSSLTKWTAIAASLAVILTGSGWGVYYLYFSEPPVKKFAPAPIPPYRPLQVVFADTVAEGFKPEWVCKDECQFVMTTYRRFGTGLALAQLPANTEALGWSYSNSISPKTAQLLGRSGDARIMVFVDKAADDKGVELPEDSQLHLFRRVTGDLVLYELSESEKPALLDALQIMAVIPDECRGRSIYDNKNQGSSASPNASTS